MRYVTLMVYGSDNQEALRLQLQQAIETIRFQFGLMVQVWGFLIAGDALLVGIGLSQDKPIMLAVASAIPVMMIVAAERIAKHVLPFLVVALSIERALLPDRGTVIGTYLRLRHARLYDQLIAAIEAADATKNGSVAETRLTHGLLIMGRATVITLIVFISQIAAFGVALHG